MFHPPIKDLFISLKKAIADSVVSFDSFLGRLLIIDVKQMLSVDGDHVTPLFRIINVYKRCRLVVDEPSPGDTMIVDILKDDG